MTLDGAVANALVPREFVADALSLLPARSSPTCWRSCRAFAADALALVPRAFVVDALALLDRVRAMPHRPQRGKRRY